MLRASEGWAASLVTSRTAVIIASHLTQMLEMIRDGESLATLMTLGQQLLGRRQASHKHSLKPCLVSTHVRFLGKRRVFALTKHQAIFGFVELLIPSTGESRGSPVPMNTNEHASTGERAEAALSRSFQRRCLGGESLPCAARQAMK